LAFTKQVLNAGLCQRFRSNARPRGGDYTASSRHSVDVGFQLNRDVCRSVDQSQLALSLAGINTRLQSACYKIVYEGRGTHNANFDTTISTTRWSKLSSMLSLPEVSPASSDSSMQSEIVTVSIVVTEKNLFQISLKFVRSFV